MIAWAAQQTKIILYFLNTINHNVINKCLFSATVNEAATELMEKCFKELEASRLEEEGLYIKEGSSSEVLSLLKSGLGKKVI